ncbi:ORF6N domain-containing protein [Variovorax sp. HW608]|uniref:ORF6N domain-containing protein n=1 Tax=Variovorax sp. HW608 TaxID=1034889 RepID=UPI00081FD6DE|nr:ORF6N domain-containing protein [Variovorax sp. HW608]SCK22298.1 ORF6N domain-containing protein [Variovorax sp. HW608]
MSAPVAAAPAVESISLSIASLRGQRVILDADLAALYEVPTKRFNEAVKRNAARFPADFMFQLSAEEWEALRSQFATSNAGRGGRRYRPFAFTEHGAIMAAMVLNSSRAVEVSTYVVRAFVRLREMALDHRDLAKRLDALEEKTELLDMRHDSFSRNTRSQLKQVFEALRQLMVQPEPSKRPIGFVTPEEKKGSKDSRARKSS